jgi:hypothetical protein
VLKQGLSKQTCDGRALRRDAAPAPTPTRRTPRRSRPCFARGDLRRGRPPSLGCAAPEASRTPRRAGVRACATRRRATRAVPAGCAPLSPAVRPRPPALLRRTTAGASRRRHRGRAVPYISTLLSSSRRPTPRPLLHRAIRATAEVLPSPAVPIATSASNTLSRTPWSLHHLQLPRTPPHLAGIRAAPAA